MFQSVLMRLQSRAGKIMEGRSGGKKDKVTGSKALRAEPYATQVEIGNVYLIKGAWNVDFIKQHELFPMGLRKDFVDCASGAFNMLIGKGRAGVWGGYNKK
jgi:phage terminase large subunit-like protein